MDKRSGVAATSAAAIIFSVIIACNLAVYIASQDRARLYSQSNAENSFADGMVALAGAGVYNLMSKVQFFLESRAFSCAGVAEAVSAEIHRLTEVQKSDNLTVVTSPSLAEQGREDDNLSMLAPLDGFSPGALDMSFRVVAFGSAGIGVSFAKSETHYAHLPVHLDAGVADCIGAVMSISDSVSTTLLPNCSSSAMTALVLADARRAGARPSEDGFKFGFELQVTGPDECAVSFQVSIAQADIAGPAGTFSVLLQERGFASFQQPVPQ